MSAIPKPWEAIDPKPLPETDAALLDEVLDYAAQIAVGESRLDSESMLKAKALNSLYCSESWVSEWMEARPAKPSAAGRPAQPDSRNRFAQWLTWRAEKQRKAALVSRQVYMLLNAVSVSDYLNHGSNKYTERTIRPLTWMVSRGYADRIPEVERRALDIANGAPITNRIMAKALAEWKKENLGRVGTTKANREAKARNFRAAAETDFRRLMADSPTEAREFLKWAAEEWKKTAALKAVS